MQRLNRLHRDERGMSYAFIGLGLMGLLSASMLAIDVGMLMTARNQAQNAADAGALAGATALLYNDFNDRSPSGPAVTSAITAATHNKVMAGDVSVKPEDVLFPNDEFGEPTRVQVTVYRREDRGNPLSTFIARLFGTKTMGVAAVATAEVSEANAMTCVKPFTIPDKWIEAQSPPWDADDTYDAYDNKGVKLAKPDVYIPAADCKGCPANPDYTGYNTERERGTKLMLRAQNTSKIGPSMYFSYAIAGVTGAKEYDWNIANCNTHIMQWGELLLHEPGAMAGPTASGIKELIAKDPDAVWDDSTNGIKNSRYGGQQSPRVFPIPLYDPAYYDAGRRAGRYADLKVANWIGYFAEEVKGYEIYGRIIPIGGIRDKYSNAPSGLNPRALRLVQ